MLENAIVTVLPLVCPACGRAEVHPAYRAGDVVYLACDVCSAIHAIEIPDDDGDLALSNLPPLNLADTAG